MKLVFRSVLLVVAALALSGVATASASAHEWFLGGVAVKGSKPVIRSGTFDIRRQETGGGEEEKFACTLSGKGTVGEKGAGSVTEWKLSGCTSEHGFGGWGCEEGTKSGPTALNFPWTTQIGEAGTKIVNRLSAKGGIAFTWQCTVAVLKSVYKVTCKAAEQSNFLENVGSEVKETWEIGQVTPMACERSFGSSGPAFAYGVNDTKGEKGETLKFV